MLCYEIAVHNTTLQYKILYSAKYLKHPKKPGHLTERKTTSNETQRDVLYKVLALHSQVCILKASW